MRWGNIFIPILQTRIWGTEKLRLAWSQWSYTSLHQERIWPIDFNSGEDFYWLGNYACPSLLSINTLCLTLTIPSLDYGNFIYFIPQRSYIYSRKQIALWAAKADVNIAAGQRLLVHFLTGIKVIDLIQKGLNRLEAGYLNYPIIRWESWAPQGQCLRDSQRYIGA